MKRIKPGYFNPPTDRPIFVPGFNWLQILVTGLQGVPVLAHLCWWTTRSEKASQKRLEESKILKKVAKLWGRRVLPIWDRGFAGAPWTTLALDHRLRFILRWNSKYHFIGPDDERQLFLVVSRPGYGRKPWFLLTTEPIHTAEQAWQIVFAYSRRWQIEISLRFTKTDLAFESPRVQAWEARHKFFLIATLAYAFLAGQHGLSLCLFLALLP
ncbi:MAG TPA: transposase [Anaerolineales bacterium]|nr:transposase [Anaerolineales bacterium]